VTRRLNVSIDEGLAIEAAQFMIAAASQDAREGTPRLSKSAGRCFATAEGACRGQSR
jgi:hypothetical protein